MRRARARYWRIVRTSLVTGFLFGALFGMAFMQGAVLLSGGAP